jgi:L-ascorbate metabolism protein UlaG (beta-lactamase superfamily)
MSSDRLYLKQDVLVEPLFNQWYAWPQLISPATAAMYIANLHIKIMQSFVATPQAHIAALKNPAMRGGPFINYGLDQVSAIKALLERTTKEQSQMLALAKAVTELDQMVSDEAQGFSLEPLYRKVPAILRGYVELVYDLNNHPSIRFVEGLLYRSPFYNVASQTMSLSLVEKDERPFVFSTPRLEREETLELKIPFSHFGLDELFKMKSVPQSYKLIKEILGVTEKEALFSSFFTEEAPPVSSRYSGDAVRIRYFGHACILFETKDVSIMCDPVISYGYGNGSGRYTYVDLPEHIDYVLITHNHQDHCMFEPLLQLRHKIRNIIVPKSGGAVMADISLKLLLENLGFANVREIEEMETIPVEGGGITGLPFFGEHADLNIRAKIAHLVKLNNKTALCAADSNNIEPKLYEHLHQQTGDIDVLFLGMECDGAPMTWLYGPLLTRPLARKMDQSRRYDGSDYQKGMEIINQLQPKQVYVYAMGQEPWLTFLTSIQYTPTARPIVESDKLVRDCESRGLVAERLYCQKEIFI